MKRNKILKAFIVFIILLVLHSVCYADSIDTNVTSKPVSHAESLNNEALPSIASENTVTLSYFCAQPPDTQGIVSSLSELDVYKELESRTGIRISFIHPSPNSQVEKLMLMVALGDLPDLIEFSWSKFTGLLNSLIENNAIIKLNDLIEKNAPNLNDILNSNKEIRRHVTKDDGSIYLFPSLNLEKSTVSMGPIIRADLLKKLGLTTPETIDEWEIVLKLFKDLKLCSSPLSFDVTTFNSSHSFISAFGTTMGFYLNDGKVAYGPIEDSYKDFLSIFSRWYKKGLIDSEFLLLKNNQVKNRVKLGDVGAFIGTADDIGSVLDTLEQDTSYKFVAVKNPVLHWGDKLAITAKAWEVNPAGGVVISCKNKYPQETAKWLDYFYGEEGQRLFNLGVEGKTYTMEDGHPVFTDLILNNPEGLSVSQAMSRYLRTDTQAPGLHTDESVKALYKYTVQKDASKRWSYNIDNNINNLMPPISLTQVENEQISIIMQDLSVYTFEMFAKFVLGVESLQSFDKYSETVKNLGVNRVTHILQTALYRYNNRLPSDQIKVIIDGNPLEMDTNPILLKGNYHIPIRFIVEALGGSVEWDDKDRIVTAKKDGVVAILKIDNADVFVDNQHKTLNTEVILLNDRTYVPTDFAAEFLEVSIHWDKDTNSVIVDSNTDEADEIVNSIVGDSDMSLEEKLQKRLLELVTGLGTLINHNQPAVRAEREAIEITKVKNEDINGDGISDMIEYTVLARPHSGMQDVILRINDSEITFQASRPSSEFNIVDINDHDKYKEIEIYDDGPSDDPVCIFFIYDGNEVKKIGELHAHEYYLNHESELLSNFDRINVFEPTIIVGRTKMNEKHEFSYQKADKNSIINKQYKIAYPRDSTNLPWSIYETSGPSMHDNKCITEVNKGDKVTVIDIENQGSRRIAFKVRLESDVEGWMIHLLGGD